MYRRETDRQADRQTDWKSLREVSSARKSISTCFTLIQSPDLGAGGRKKVMKLEEIMEGERNLRGGVK